jgi:hypothetical protein
MFDPTRLFGSLDSVTATTRRINFPFKYLMQQKLLLRQRAEPIPLLISFMVTTTLSRPSRFQPDG